MTQTCSGSLRIGGMVPLTTLDYPGHLSCVLFCQGCAWRCRYCHNPGLIPPRGKTEIAWHDVLAFLDRRQGLLDAVVFSGGEATLQPALASAMNQVRERGFKVGLHSAGIKPDALQRVLPLCDWVGFDIKALAEHTAMITGVTASGASNWHSLKRLLASGVDYECRVTVHWQLMNAEHLLHLAQALQVAGVRRLAIQLARSGTTLQSDLPDSVAPSHADQLWADIRPRFDDFILRS